MRFEIPEKFRRNSHMVKEAGYDQSAREIIALMAERLGLSDFSKTKILDVGCGTRFTACIINNHIPVKSYTGVDVDAEIIEFLGSQASKIDENLQYHHWNVHNALYNPTGSPLELEQQLPMQGKFDVIWLFSVFTHLNPQDSAAMLRILSNHIEPDGKLIFTCRVNNSVEGFIDRIPETPLLRVVYSQALMEDLITNNGWKIEKFYTKDPRDFIRNYYICSPSNA